MLSLVGNWITTIQANIKDFPPLSVGDPLRPEHLAAVNSKVDVAANSSGSLRTTFWTSKNFVDWSFVGVLTCPACDLCVQSCSDFYQIPAAAAAAATISSTGGGETVVASNRWVFGINTGGCGLRSGGMITGMFDRASLTLTPDRPEWATAVLAGDRKAAQHWAYLLWSIHESNANGICLSNASFCPRIWIYQHGPFMTRWFLGAGTIMGHFRFRNCRHRMVAALFTRGSISTRASSLIGSACRAFPGAHSKRV